MLVFTGKGVRAEVGVRDSIAMKDSDCISCGQCTLVCPVGALAEKDDTERVIDYFYDPDIYTVIQIAPATRVALGEEFNMGYGSNVEGRLISAFQQLGADVVLDTNFTADLVIMEEGNELLQRVTDGGVLPMFTSCSPGWVNWLEKNHPERLPHLSTVKSPQQCFGAIAKTYLADKMQVDPARMRVISIMPCTAKKEEALRPEFTGASGIKGRPDVDVVLTTPRMRAPAQARGHLAAGIARRPVRQRMDGRVLGSRGDLRHQPAESPRPPSAPCTSPSPARSWKASTSCPSAVTRTCARPRWTWAPRARSRWAWPTDWPRPRP